MVLERAGAGERGRLLPGPIVGGTLSGRWVLKLLGRIVVHGDPRESWTSLQSPATAYPGLSEGRARARASREFAGALRPSRTSRLPPPGVSPGLSGPARLSRAYADETSVASGVRRAHRLGPSV